MAAQGKQAGTTNQSTLWRVAQLLLGAFLLCVAGFVVAGKLDSDRALTALALVAAVGVITVLRPRDIRDLVGRLTKAGPLEFEAREAKTAAADTIGTEADDQGYQETLVDLRLKLEAKMAYIAKHLLGTVPDDTEVSGDANFVTVGSLKLDDLLSSEQARTAAHILTWTDHDLARAGPHEASVFLAAANDLVSGVRASVFASMVRKRLTAAGWDVKAAEPEQKHRDWLADKDGRLIRIVPVFATSEPSAVLASVKARLEKQFGDAGAYVIVIPEHSATNTSESPPVVRLNGLLEMLE